MNLDHLTLPAGVYTLRVDWGPNAKLEAYPETFYPQPPFTWHFEYRDVSTETDLLDLHFHQAHRAFYDRQQSDEALVFINEVLARRSMSTIALSLRADILMATGACREAVADWQRATGVLRRGGDPLRKPRGMDDPDDTQRITAWQKKVEGSPCR